MGAMAEKAFSHDIASQFSRVISGLLFSGKYRQILCHNKQKSLIFA
jgi:hypothetical protein